MARNERKWSWTELNDSVAGEVPAEIAAMPNPCVQAGCPKCQAPLLTVRIALKRPEIFIDCDKCNTRLTMVLYSGPAQSDAPSSATMEMLRRIGSGS